MRFRGRLPGVRAGHDIKPDDTANREERKPESRGWVPPCDQQEGNPLATGAWLPAKDPPPRRTPAPTRWLRAESEPEPAPGDSWLPPELLTESEREASAAALWATPAREPVAAPDPRSVPAPAPERAKVEPPSPIQGETAAEFKRADQRDEAADYGRRTRAVNAYCRELFTTTRAPGVADQLLNSLNGAITEDVTLLEVTRTGAAKRLTDGHPSDHEPTECSATPGRLAARANGTLEGPERDRLERHLASCLVCMAAERRSARADMAFAAVLGLKSFDR